MKKLSSLLLLFALFFLLSETASAQFTFFNGTPCAVRILGGFNYAPNPCTGPTCSTPWVSVPGGTSVTLSGAGAPCPAPFPVPSANFFGYKLVISSTSSTSVDICSTPVSTILDCNGVSRTVQIFSFNLGGIF